jgi:MoxR-like ATPase
VLAAWRGSELIRLQCYEGLDVAQAVYEWDYGRQLLHLRAAEASGRIANEAEHDVEMELFSEEFLIRRPILRAIDQQKGPSPVLLIDEIDRADDEFEAFLLEVLSEYTVTIPELGEFRAVEPPVVVITSNRTRDVHDALKRRCLYHWVDHPDIATEANIIRTRLPEVSASLSNEVAEFAAQLRDAGLYKPPGIAESLDWARALVVMGEERVSVGATEKTLGALLKYREDHQRIHAAGLSDMVASAVAGAAPL